MAWAVVVNFLLTIAQIVGGVLSGSLSLIADAIHNLSDAMSLAVAYAARRIARRPADKTRTFGFSRSEIIAALVNYTTLIIIGLYLIYEAVLRFFDPHPIAGWPVVIIASIALVVDLITVFLTYALSKESMNVRAAFLHNLADALGSVGVIIAGTLIILYDWNLIDPIITLLIAGYVLWHAFLEIGDPIRILMLGTPPDVDLGELLHELKAIDDVEDVHHVHAWMIDEHNSSLEAHVVIAEERQHKAEFIKHSIKRMLRERYDINHATLEIELPSETCDEEQTVGHSVDNTA